MERLFLMRIYEVQGRGAKSGRARKRLYKATVEDDARTQAEADGTLIETIKDLGPEPPTENQIAYANSLGIRIPLGATFADVSYMITNAVHKEDPASNVDMDLARNFGLEPPSKYMNREDLAEFIYRQLDSAQQVQWFLYMVFRRRASKRVRGRITSPVAPELIQLAKQLERDQKTVESIRRQGIIPLDGVVPDQTRAYAEAIRVLRPVLGLANDDFSSANTRSGTRGKTKPSNAKPKAEHEKRAQHSPTLLIFIVVLIFILWFFW